MLGIFNYLRTLNVGKKYNPEQIEMGIEVEKEHTDLLDLIKKYLKKHELDMPISDEEFFKTIARAHLDELPDYYTRLKAIEGEH